MSLQVEYLIPIMLALRRWTQEGEEFKTSLIYTTSARLVCATQDLVSRTRKQTKGTGWWCAPIGRGERLQKETRVV